MTTHELAAVTYAMRFAAYCGGSHYGQDGGQGPSPDGLLGGQASYLRGAVSRGMSAATALADGNDVMAEHHLAEFKWMIRMALKFAFLDAVTMEAAYQAGFIRVESIRK